MGQTGAKNDHVDAALNFGEHQAAHWWQLLLVLPVNLLPPRFCVLVDRFW